MLCSKCGTQNNDNATFCKNCGAKVYFAGEAEKKKIVGRLIAVLQTRIVSIKERENAIRLCEKCHIELEDGAKFCKNCGAKINAGTPDIPNGKTEEQHDSSIPTSSNGKFFDGAREVIDGLLFIYAVFFAPAWSIAWLFAVCFIIYDNIAPLLISPFLIKFLKIESNLPIAKRVQVFRLIISAIALVFIFTNGAAPSPWLIEKFSGAVDTVNKIITENQLSKSECGKIIVTEKISDKRIKGKAFINDNKGSTVDIEITIGDGNFFRFLFGNGVDLYVEIPAARLQFWDIE
jgi:hypothetical protein